MSTIGKQQMILHLQESGYSKNEAEKIVDSLLELIQSNLIQGNKVTLKNIGTLAGEIKKKEQVKKFGKTLNYPNRIKIKFTQSRVIQNIFLNGTKKLKLTELKNLFKK